MPQKTYLLFPLSPRIALQNPIFLKAIWFVFVPKPYFFVKYSNKLHPHIYPLFIKVSSSSLKLRFLRFFFSVKDSQKGDPFREGILHSSLFILHLITPTLALNLKTLT